MAASRVRVTLSAAMSIDGKIASRTGDSELSSRSDLVRVHRLRALHDAILVGINTVRIDDPLLTVRYAKGRNPVRVILDARASLCAESRIASTSREVSTIVAASRRAPARRLEHLRNMGIDVVVSRGDAVCIRSLLVLLRRRGMRSLLVEGGSTVNWEFVRLGLVDEAVICIVPRLVGGTSSASLVGGAGFAKIMSSPRMRLCGVSRRGSELVVRYVKL